MTDEYKRRIIRKAIKFGCDRNGGSIRFEGRLYYVNIAKDSVVRQKEYK